MPTDRSLTIKPHVTMPYYERLMADMDSILWEADAQTFQYTYVSEQAERLLGYPIAQWLQPNFGCDHLHPADRDSAIDGYRRATNENRNLNLEYRMMAADGRIVWLRNVVSMIKADNQVSKLCGIMTDITERKQAEEAQQAHLHFLESMDKINRAIQGTNDFTQMLHDVLDATLAIFDCDRAWLLYPCDPDATTWSVPMECTRPEYPGAFITGMTTDMDADMAQAFRTLRASNGPLQFGPRSAYPLPVAAAKQHQIQSAIVMAIYPKVDKPYLLGLHQCAYPRLWTPQEEQLFQAIGRRLADALNSLVSYRHLQESERRYREIFDNSSDVLAIAEVTTEGRFKLLDVNPALCKMLGLNQNQLIGAFLEDFAQLHESARIMLAEHRQCLAQRAPVAVERAWETPTGRWHVHFTLIPVSDDAGQIYRIVGMGRNLTAQKSAEDRLRVFLDHATDAFFLHDASGIILDVNRRACEMLGYTHEELIGMSPLVFDPNLDLQAEAEMNRRLTAGQTIIAERHHRRKDGSVYPIEIRIRPVWQNGQQFNVSLVQDITERKRVESELRASEARFRTFVDHATDGFFLQAAGGMIVDINRQACESLGYSREELIGQLPSFFDPDWTPAFAVSLRQRLNAGEIVTFEARHRRKDGSIFPVEVRVRSFTLEGRTFGLGLVRDITRRKQAQEALTLFRTLIDHTNDSIEIVDPETGRYLDVNAQGCLTHGYTRSEFLALTLPEIDPHLANIPWAELQQRMRQAKSRVFESEHRRKDGSVFPVEVTANYITLDRDYLIAIVRDITQRNQAAAALKESEERYRTLYEANPTMYFTVDSAGIILSVNRFGAEHLGYTVAELTGNSVLDVFYEEDKAAAQIFVRQCIAHPGEIFHWSLRKVHKNGALLWVEETARAVQDVNGLLVVLIVCEDITERKRTEQALIESHNLLNAIVEGTTDMTFAKDREGRYLMMNSAGARLMGRPLTDIIGKDDHALFPPAIADDVMRKDRLIMARGETQTFEETIKGSVVRTFLTTKGVYRDSYGTVNGIVAISREITEFKRLEEQFRQAQKMEAVGRLAGGIAHDFNNLLTVINGYSQLIFNRLPVTDPNRLRLAEIQKAGERAASLTRQLLAFSRKQMLQPEVVNLNTLLTELLKLLQRLIGEDIELALTTAVDLGLTKVDPGQFEQAIINLAVNARDAMPHGGRLTIATCNAELDATYAERYPEVQAGSYVCVTVKDTGCGMDEVTVARIFEPFFTTKDVGKGTGLGLAMVYGFVKQSGGHVEVFSEVGRGTTFHIYLPCTEETRVMAEADLVQRDIPKGTETILLVEDEEAVHNLFRSVLHNSGYTVLEAYDGQRALELAQQHPTPIHLLITDLVMPRMSGRQLADRLRILRPNMCVLFMSGYTEEAVAHHRVQELKVAFLQKPFDPHSLAQKVRELLDGQAK
jgi:PAS domain S-box-containing protein